MSLKEKIIAESKRLGIDKIGFASADPFYELESSLREQRAKGHTSGFEHQVIEERIYPERTFENPQTIIAIALAYPTKIKEKVPRDEKRGMFARASWGIDYHDILRDRLEKLIQFIKAQAENLEAAENWRFAPQVDCTACWFGVHWPQWLIDHGRIWFFCLFRRDRHQYFLRNR